MLMVPGVLRRALPYLQSCKTMDAAHMIGLGKNYPIDKMYNYAVKDGNNNVSDSSETRGMRDLLDSDSNVDDIDKNVKPTHHSSR